MAVHVERDVGVGASRLVGTQGKLHSASGTFRDHRLGQLAASDGVHHLLIGGSVPAGHL